MASHVGVEHLPCIPEFDTHMRHKVAPFYCVFRVRQPLANSKWLDWGNGYDVQAWPGLGNVKRNCPCIGTDTSDDHEMQYDTTYAPPFVRPAHLWHNFCLTAPPGCLRRM